MSNNTIWQYIRDNSTEASLYEQLAEECIELAFVCISKARLLRGESPSTKNHEDLDNSIDEEATDVNLCLDVLGKFPNYDIYEAKLRRWEYRLKDREID